jgi:hypothetical protein
MVCIKLLSSLTSGTVDDVAAGVDGREDGNDVLFCSGYVDEDVIVGGDGRVLI